MKTQHANNIFLAIILGLATVLLFGCPYNGTIIWNPPIGGGSTNPGETDQEAYDRGFAAGFARDDWYWDGYFDGYNTMSFTPIYYDDSNIPYLESPPYDAGYWDGVWYAYNDGYFVDYHYAFIIGFSEGYDNAYWPDYLAFLARDQHTEFRHGGWIDGYHDGFSEGRVFGANDYEQGLPFDWLDALRDYERGTDLYFVEVGIGTGVYGPVILYEYGTNPHLTKIRLSPRDGHIIRNRNETILFTKTTEANLYRPLTNEVQSTLSVTPQTSLRPQTPTLRLQTTWLQRVQSYLQAKKSDLQQKELSVSPRIRACPK